MEQTFCGVSGQFHPFLAQVAQGKVRFGSGWPGSQLTVPGLTGT